MGYNLITTLVLEAAGFQGGIDNAKQKVKELKQAAGESTEAMKGSFQQLLAPLSANFAGLQQLTSGFGGLGGAAKTMIPILGILKTAMIALPIFAIITAVISLITWLKKTEEGFAVMTKGIDLVKAVIRTVLDTLKMLGEALVKLFHGDFKGAAEEAKEAFTTVGERLKENIALANNLAELQEKQRLIQSTEVLDLAKLEHDAAVLREQYTDKDTYNAKQRNAFISEYRDKLKQIEDIKLKDAEIEKEIYIANNGGLENVNKHLDLKKGLSEIEAKIFNIQSEYEDSVKATNRMQHANTEEMAKQLEALKKANEVKEVGVNLSKFDILKNTGIKAVNVTDLVDDGSGKQKKAVDAFKQQWIEASAAIKASFELTFKNTQLADIFATVATKSLQKISGALGEGGSSFKDYAKNVKSAIKETIGAFIAEGVAALVGNALKTAAKLGPLGIALAPALAALAGGLAKTAFNSLIPNFSEGGVIGGYSYTGDNVPAMVNSGEMILNNAQQGNLFNMLNGGTAGGELTTRVAGSDLIFVLNNAQRKVNSYR